MHVQLKWFWWLLLIHMGVNQGMVNIIVFAQGFLCSNSINICMQIERSKQKQSVWLLALHLERGLSIARVCLAQAYCL